MHRAEKCHYAKYRKPISTLLKLLDNKQVFTESIHCNPSGREYVTVFDTTRELSDEYIMVADGNIIQIPQLIHYRCPRPQASTDRSILLEDGLLLKASGSW